MFSFLGLSTRCSSFLSNEKATPLDLTLVGLHKRGRHPSHLSQSSTVGLHPLHRVNRFGPDWDPTKNKVLVGVFRGVRTRRRKWVTLHLSLPSEGQDPFSISLLGWRGADVGALSMVLCVKTDSLPIGTYSLRQCLLTRGWRVETGPESETCDGVSSIVGPRPRSGRGPRQ